MYCKGFCNLINTGLHTARIASHYILGKIFDNQQYVSKSVNNLINFNIQYLGLSYYALLNL